MATIVLKAIEIITADGNGIPVPGPVSQIGLAADGHIVLITGRPTIVSVTGDTARTDWISGILAKNASSYQPGEHADFVEAGCFTELGDFEFAVKNTQAYIETCEANGVYLSHRTLIYYHVTSSDGSAFNFERRGTYVIEEIPSTKLITTFKCINNALSIFKSTPKQLVTKDAYPTAPSDSLDKPIPIAMGYVAQSPLINISQPGEKVVLVRTLLGSVVMEYTACGLRNYNSATHSLNLYTKGVAFAANDASLKDCMLTVIAGGSDQSLHILSNLATDGSENTNVTLSGPLTGSFVGWGGSTTSSAMWFGEVQKVNATLIASSRPIFEIAENNFGRPALSIWDSDAKRFRDVSDISRTFSETNIKATGFPGVDVFAQALESDGKATAYFKIKCGDIQMRSILGSTWSGPASGAQPNLFDGDQGTGYQISNADAGIVQLDITIPSSVIDQNFDDLYLMMDANFHLSSGSGVGNKFGYLLFGQDVYGHITDQIGAGAVLLPDSISMTTATINRFSIHGSYYNQDTSPDLFYTLKDDGASLGSLLDSLKKARAFPRIMVQIDTFGSNLVTNLLEIAFVGKRTVNVINSTVYTTVKGEVAGTTWDDRIDPSDHLHFLPQAIEHLARNYDTKGPVWQAAHAYIIGDKIRGTADTGHLFVCTTAGTSHVSVEPTWTDTTGATYTDGTVTWKEWKEIPIDTASFDFALLTRLSWFFGWTLDKVGNTFDWIKEACEKGFLIGMIDRYGRLKVKPWRDLSTPLYAFTYGAGGNILEGTFEDMPMSDISKIYNDILIKYDWNYAAGKFNQQLFITKIDEPAFPGISEPVVTGTSLGAFSITGTVDGFITYYTINTTLPHGLSNGEYASLSGNADGFNFDPAAVGVIDTTHFVVIVPYALWLANPSTSGTLVKNPVSRLKWKDYVGGLRNYARAKELWDKAHLSYTVTGVVQKLPDKLGECKMFIDPYAKFNGKYIWSDDGGTTPSLDVGDDHPAVFYADNLLEWNPWPKKMPEFEVADEPAVSIYNIGDCVSVLHPKLTQGVAKVGWIFDRTELPRDDANKLPERFRFGVMLKPDLAPTTTQILESGSQPNTITESGSQPDTYTEGA